MSGVGVREGGEGGSGKGEGGSEVGGWSTGY